MALGTVTVRKQGGGLGDLWYVVADVRPTSGANYTTTGEVFGAAQVGRTGNVLAVLQVGSGSALRRVVWIPSTLRLQALAAATDVEIAGNSDLSAANDSVRLLIIGK